MENDILAIWTYLLYTFINTFSSRSFTVFGYICVSCGSRREKLPKIDAEVKNPKLQQIYEFSQNSVSFKTLMYLRTFQLGVNLQENAQGRKHLSHMTKDMIFSPKGTTNVQVRFLSRRRFFVFGFSLSLKLAFFWKK